MRGETLGWKEREWRLPRGRGGTERPSGRLALIMLVTLFPGPLGLATAGRPPSPERCGRWGHTPAFYINHFTSVDFSSCQEENINHPVAVSVRKSSIRFPGCGWQNSGGPSVCEQVGGVGGPWGRSAGHRWLWSP